jgi:hypothetical protein
MHKKPVGILVLVAALAASALGPGVAQAADSSGVIVCNEAQSSPRGVDVVLDQTDPNPPARHKNAAMPVGNGNGAGLVNAAAHSPALAVCTPPPIVGGTGGGTT